jgi:hypothetical protein
MKGNRASVKIEWTDILQQRLNISQTINANFIEDSEFIAMTSYVMVSFSYRFNNLKNVNKNRVRNFQNTQQGGGVPRSKN